MQNHSFRLFGLTLSTDFAFANRLAPGAGSPDLTFTCVKESPLPGALEQAQPVYASPYRTKDGESQLYLYLSGDCAVMRFPGVADFYLWSDHIVCHLPNPSYAYMVEIRLLGPVLSFWLEQHGIAALHASAVAINERAVAFLSSNKGGKSSLAAMLVKAGYPLLTDDILPVERCESIFLGRPGYPTMRMWPDEAQYFLGYYEKLELVHPELDKRRVPLGPGGLGNFCSTAQPLACLYLPERYNPQGQKASIEITPISPRNATVELVRHSFSARVVEAAGWASRRLEFFAHMARQVPMRRLVYPSGFERLPVVQDAILADSGFSG